MGREVIRTTCPYCGVGCGVRATRDASALTLDGDPLHPANRGALCSKGSALGETLGHEGRLLHPSVDGRRASWSQAIKAVAAGLSRTVERHGPDAVAFYVSGQLLTEDYYVANKLMKGFIGSANIDTNSRLCMASAVAAQKRAFGADAVPCSYQDLEQAQLVVLAGSNAAWTHPILYRRVSEEKHRRGNVKVVVIDPRRTPTCDVADLHLPLKPGTDAWLFNGLLCHLYRENALDLDFIDAHTNGLTGALRAARQAAPSVPAVAAACELPEAEVSRFFQWFTNTDKTVTLWSQGLNQSTSGTDKGSAIINVHLATGRIGRPGAGPFSLTGQPNAMGGREVGGLANTLAAHMDFDQGDVERVRRFWDAPRMAQAPGLKAVQLFDAIERGSVKAVWIMATNPAVSLPDADRVRAALERCDLVIVSDCATDTDTVACADIVLPAATWGEKDGTVTNSERRISRSRAFLRAPGEARPDWWIITQVAHAMGFQKQFVYCKPADIFREHAALSGLGNDGTRAFDISALADLSDADYDALTPVQWPLNRAIPRGAPRLFTDGLFRTRDTRARFVAVTPRTAATRPGTDYPLVLNTGRIRDQWHTMTRTGHSARLTAHIGEPFVQAHPADARAYRLVDGALARVSSARGELLARVRVEPQQRPGSVFVPIHWSDAFARRARAGALLASRCDPLSGQPEYKHGAVTVAPYRADWHGFILSRAPLRVDTGEYRATIWGRAHYRYELAGGARPDDWGAWAQSHLMGSGEWLEYADPAEGCYRFARIDDGRLAVVACIAPDRLPERAWLGQLFERDHLDDTARMSLLAGRPPTGQQSAGRTVCSCFGVGLNTLTEAVATSGLASVEALGDALGAGTNCGSCIPELRQILAESQGVS